MSKLEDLTFKRSEKNAGQDGCDEPDCIFCTFGHTLRRALGTLVEAAQDLARLREGLVEMRATSGPTGRIGIIGDKLDDLIEDAAVATVVAFTSLTQVAKDGTPEGRAFSKRERTALNLTAEVLLAQTLALTLLQELDQDIEHREGRED